MIVCLCSGVSDRTVRLAVVAGARSVDAVAACSGAGTDCGTCRHAIQDLIQDLMDEARPSSLGRGKVGDGEGDGDGVAATSVDAPYPVAVTR